MASASPNLRPPEPRRFSLRVPRALSIAAVATGALIVAAVGFRFGVPIWRQWATLREIRRFGCEVCFSRGGPEWLHDLIGDEGMQLFQLVEGFRFLPDETTFSRRAFGDLSGRGPFWTSEPTIDDERVAIAAHAPSAR